MRDRVPSTNSVLTLGFDGAGSVVGNLATGQPLTFEGIALGLAIGLGTSVGAGAFAKLGGRIRTAASDYTLHPSIAIVRPMRNRAGRACGARAVATEERSG
jgi:hypothetical protein